MPHDSADFINRSLADNHFARKVREWRQHASAVLKAEDAAFKLAMRTARLQRILTGAAVLLTGLLVVVLLSWRRAAKARVRLQRGASRLA
ncbi:MAG: hypothetical protein NTX64_04335, partial [Elusimicrobia bacterium]|nr:hypothetical protein [Elusimicrobiota bacterium]